MATHSSILAWRIPKTEGPGGLQSVGSQRAGRVACTHTRHLLGVVNTAVKNNCVEVMFEYLFLFLWCISISVIARLYSNSGLPWWLRQ